MSEPKYDYRSRRGSRFIRTDCLDCGKEANPNTGEHNQRAWARTHVMNNPGHQVHVEVTSIRVYTSPTPTPNADEGASA